MTWTEDFLIHPFCLFVSSHKNVQWFLSDKNVTFQFLIWKAHNLKMNGAFSHLYFIQEFVGLQFVPPSNLLWIGFFFSCRWNQQAFIYSHLLISNSLRPLLPQLFIFVIVKWNKMDSIFFIVTFPLKVYKESTSVKIYTILQTVLFFI